MTRTNVDYADLQEAIETLIKAKFPGGEIRRVYLREGADGNGEKVLEITVIFDGGIEGIAENAPLSLLGELRETISEHVLEGFPYLNFVSASDLAA